MDETALPPEPEDEISLLDLALVLARHKRRILGFTAAVAVLSLVVSLLLPKTYTGTTRILPPQAARSGSSAMLAQIAGLAGAAGGLAELKNPSDLYAGMLKSRTVADALIQRFHLRDMYSTDLDSTTRKTLEGHTTITLGKDGILTIEVEDRDPQRAADLANGYVDELYKLTQVLAVTEASRSRLFYERQLVRARESLAQAEAAARTAMARGGIASIDVAGRSLIELTGRLRGEISAKEVQIAAMHSFAAEQNPELKVAQQQLAALKGQLAHIEGTAPLASPPPPAQAGKGDMDVPGEDNLALLRDVKYYETVVDLLSRQYELAKIAEAKDAALIQVLDRAVTPDHKSKPKRALIVLLSTLAAMFMGILWAFLAEATTRARTHPDTAARWEELRRALRWRR